MKTIEPHISDYIDIAIERERKIFQKDIQLHQEFWKHEFSLVVEILKDKPGREEVRGIVRDELSYHPHGLHR